MKLKFSLAFVSAEWKEVLFFLNLNILSDRRPGTWVMVGTWFAVFFYLFCNLSFFSTKTKIKEMSYNFI
jgi:hypothetical protein